MWVCKKNGNAWVWIKSLIIPKKKGFLDSRNLMLPFDFTPWGHTFWVPACAGAHLKSSVLLLVNSLFFIVNRESQLTTHFHICSKWNPNNSWVKSLWCIRKIFILHVSILFSVKNKVTRQPSFFPRNELRVPSTGWQAKPARIHERQFDMFANVALKVTRRD